MTTLHIVHGWAYSTDKWSRCIELLEQSGIEVIMLNVPGLTAPSDQVWDISGYKDWLDGQLDGVRDPIILGHSNGGRILLNYSSEKPGKIKHIILLNSAGVWVNPKAIGMKRKAIGLAAKMLRPLRRISLLRKVLYRIVGASDYNNAPDNMKKTLGNMLASDRDLDISAVKDPVSIIWGREDKMTPLTQGHKISKELQDVRGYDIIDDSGHAPYYTHPEELARAIVNAVGRV